MSMTGKKERIKYSFYLLLHPFKGFDGIKNEGMGGTGTAAFHLLFFILSTTAFGLYGGFLFNADGRINFNVYKQTAIILMVFLFWCVANWCLTSLFEGEGTFKDIFKYSGYSLLPLSVTQLVGILLSNVLTLREESFFTMVFFVGMLWTGFLLFTGTVVTHQYAVLKTVLIIICTLLGMCIITYILLLSFNLVQQIIGFIMTFWRELSLRMT